MKCPKCGYLGFESGDNCRNCGYEFSLSDSKLEPFDLALDLGPVDERPPLDLDRIIGAPEPVPSDDLPLFPPAQTDGHERRASPRNVEAFSKGGDDAPLISTPSRPRAPLGVRRATPEVPRARQQPPKAPPLAETLFEPPPAAIERAFESARYRDRGDEALAGPASRILAALVDIALLSTLDASVLYFTLRLLGLATAQMFELPVMPLLAFFLLLNGGYFIAFTTVGGQSIGKMAVGIKVISQEEESVPIGRATLRTLAYIVSALPLGAGFLPGLISADRLALHDRLAHTRVVRPSST
jgi:uncharacterized RDD family membrane protein YckC